MLTALTLSIFAKKTMSPNTKHDRKRLQKEFQYRYHNEMTQQERDENDRGVFKIKLIIFIVICAIVTLFS